MNMRDLDDYGETGLKGEGELLVAPSATGFIGGDAVCGIIAARLHLASEPCLLIDLGTNGEIVLSCEGRLFAASASAGPAFEGYRISSGMRASVGAIDSVKISDALEIAYTVIGNGKPRGICGCRSAAQKGGADLQGPYSSACGIEPDQGERILHRVEGRDLDREPYCHYG
jgi:uncharacterized 2Fe-2S/4Fe-4S cluster protein (DUF4445 family)